jgi:O-antigen/teichoic acid export membrane protein
VPVVFGQKWLPSVSVLQILGFLILPGTVNHFFAPLMVAVGSTSVVMRQSIIMVFLTALFLWIGARWGMEGVLIAHVLRVAAASAYNLHAMTRAVGLKVTAVLQVLLPPCVACAIMTGAVWMAKHELSQHVSGVPLLLLLIAIGAVTYGAALFGGDVIGLWKGYLVDATRSLKGIMVKRGSAVAG